VLWLRSDCTARRTVGTDTRVNSLKDGSYVCAVPSINAWSRARKFKSILNQDRTRFLPATTSVMTVVRYVQCEPLPLSFQSLHLFSIVTSLSPHVVASPTQCACAIVAPIEPAPPPNPPRQHPRSCPYCLCKGSAICLCRPSSHLTGPRIRCNDPPSQNRA
jgi:hypothetical protein